MDSLLHATFRAEREHFWFRGFRKFVVPLIEQGLAGVPSPDALDCGCGTGANLSMLGQRANVFGFDLTRVGLQYARDHGRHRVARASITHIPFASDRFDLVTSFDVIQCLTEEQAGWALAEMARLIKPGGALLINVAALEMLHGNHSVLAEERKRYTRAELRAAMGRAGLTVERLTYTNFSIFPVMLAVRTLQRRGHGQNHTERSGLQRELTVPAKPVNAAFTALLSLEALALRRMDMPVGSSLLCLARKPPARA